MEDISKRNKELLIITAILAVVALALYGFLFLEVKRKNESISNLRNEIELQEKQEHLLRSVKTTADASAALRTKIDTYIVAQDGTAEFIEMIQAIGRRGAVAVTVDSVEAVALPAAKDMEELRIVMHTEGSWADSIRFLGTLELLPVEHSFERVRIERPRASENVRWRSDYAIRVLKVQ